MCAACYLVRTPPWDLESRSARPALQITTTSVETSVGSVTMKDFTYTDNMRYSALYFLFTYFWTSEFILAVGQVRVQHDEPVGTFASFIRYRQLPLHEMGGEQKLDL